MPFNFSKFKYSFLVFWFITNTNVPMRAATIQPAFENPAGSPEMSSTPADWILFVARRMLGWDNSRKRKVMQNYTLNRDVALQGLLQKHTAGSITWMGHATFFINLGQVHILTDPFFSDTAGKFGLGARRHNSSPLHIEDLPRLDIILCSHNHYDHLDVASLKRIRTKFGAQVQVFCPLGLAKYFRKCGFTNIKEMAWNEEAKHQEMAIHCLPAIHNSGRSLFDKNKTLWCGFGLKTKVFDIYFSGDTAYHPKVFKAIGAGFGHFDLAIVGIGAYAPQALLEAYHANPEQAVQIALDVRAKNIVGMHWGTLNLSDEPADEPIKRFAKAAQTHEFCPELVWLMKLGETRSLGPE